MHSILNRLPNVYHGHNFDVKSAKEFAQLMIQVEQAKGADKITAEEVSMVLRVNGVETWGQLASNLSLVPGVTSIMTTIIASRG